jgi:ABC-type antimicrobial peptide transport system permease subunit
MKELLEISKSYWKCNKKQLFQLISVLILTMAGLVSACLYGRSALLGQLDNWLNERGNFDISVYYPDDEISEFLMNDDRFIEKSKIFRIGTGCFDNDITVDVGYFADNQAEDMFHLQLVEGHFPEKENEICIDELTLKELGYAAKINQEIHMTINTNDGLSKENDYKIVGIIKIKSQGEYGISYARLNQDRAGNEYYPPLIYMFKDDARQITDCENDYIFLGNVNYIDGFDDYSMLYELNTKFEQIICSDTTYNFSRSQIIAAITMQDNAYLREGIGYLANEKYIGSELMQKDYYNGVLIPVFFIIFVLVTIFSLYSVLKLTLVDRYKEIGILRCLGMEMRQLIAMLMIEMAIFLFAGLIVGFILGVLIYAITLIIQKNIYSQDIIWAFKLDDFWGKYISMVTHNPYIIPALIIILVVTVVFFFYIVNNLRNNSPSEVILKKTYRHKFRKIDDSLVGGFHYFLIVIMIFVIMATFYGYLSYRKLADDNSEEQQDIIDNIGTSAFDYVATLDVSDTLLGYNQLLHSSGINRDNYESIASDSNVEKSIGYIANISTKLVLDSDNKWNEVLQNGNCRYVENDSYTEEDNLHFQKVDDIDWRYKGYSDDENLYQVPMFGFTESNMEMFDKYIIAGSIDNTKLESGEEVLLIIDSMEKLSYFSVGDVLDMTDVIYDESIDNDENIPMGIVPEELTETEFIDGIPFYALGERFDFKVKIGAIAVVDDDLADMIWKSYPVPNSGIRLVTGIDSFKTIGLPDENITDLYVKLKNYADSEAFEGKWYSAVLYSNNISNFNVTELISSVTEKEKSSMLIFYALFFVFGVISIVCIYNIISVMIQKSKEKVLILRRIGATRCKIQMMFCKKLALYPLIAGAVSCVLCKAYMILVNISYNLKNTYGQILENGNEIKKWYDIIPCLNIEKYHPFIILVLLTLLAIIIVELITIIAVKKNFVEE